MSCLSTAHPLTACAVAQLVGCDYASRFLDLPVGFRLRWNEAEAADAFKSCRSVGDYVIAYCDHITHGMRARQAAAR